MEPNSSGSEPLQTLGRAAPLSRLGWELSPVWIHSLWGGIRWELCAGIPERISGFAAPKQTAVLRAAEFMKLGCLGRSLLCGFSDV